MNGIFGLGFFLGALSMYLVIMIITSRPDPDWRESFLAKLLCYDCDKRVAMIEFQLHGGLCEDCFKERHGYNQSSETSTKEGGNQVD